MLLHTMKYQHSISMSRGRHCIQAQGQNQNSPIIPSWRASFLALLMEQVQLGSMRKTDTALGISTGKFSEGIYQVEEQKATLPETWQFRGGATWS